MDRPVVPNQVEASNLCLFPCQLRFHVHDGQHVMQKPCLQLVVRGSVWCHSPHEWHSDASRNSRWPTSCQRWRSVHFQQPRLEIRVKQYIIAVPVRQVVGGCEATSTRIRLILHPNSHLKRVLVLDDDFLDRKQRAQKHGLRVRKQLVHSFRPVFGGLPVNAGNQ